MRNRIYFYFKSAFLIMSTVDQEYGDYYDEESDYSSDSDGAES